MKDLFYVSRTIKIVYIQVYHNNSVEGKKHLKVSLL